MARVGALSPSKTIVNPDAALAATGMKVVVIDTGVDSSHPDLNVEAFVDLVDSPGSTYYKRDGNGHGEHCIFNNRVADDVY
jgi:subtilisin family serine protease